MKYVLIKIHSADKLVLRAAAERKGMTLNALAESVIHTYADCLHTMECQDLQAGYEALTEDAPTRRHT
ncbi:MAG: hypothetical protein LBS99_00650 [Clostridiales bacterium]|nr:hypothetical protein [Clostridiales bacterium]